MPKLFMKNIVLIIISIISANQSFAKNTEKQTIHDFIQVEVAEPYQFAGLALYLNQISYFGYVDGVLEKLDQKQFEISKGLYQQLIVTGRYKALVLDVQGEEFTIINGLLELQKPLSERGDIGTIFKNDLVKQYPEFSEIRYHQLWWPLAQLTVFFEFVLRLLSQVLGGIWGLAILLFAIIIKLVLLPLSLATERAQKRVSQVQSTLLPQLNDIKANYDGEEAHNKIMAAHKAHGVSPFFTLKPLIFTLVQIPFLIAIFNALGEMPELRHASLLWISDLSLPDRMFQLAFNVPMFGNWFNILPFIMFAVSWVATQIHRDDNLSNQVLKSQKLRLYLMALVFFILFYPFPTAMVYYWTLVNLFQLIIQKCFISLKIR